MNQTPSDVTGEATPRSIRFDARQSPRRTARTRLFVMLGLAVFGGVDIVMAKTTLDLVLRGEETLSIFTAVGITGIAIVGAWQAGSLAKDGKRKLTMLSVLAPAAVSIALFWLRWQSGIFQADSVLYDGVVSGATAHATREQVIAVVMGLVFVATTVLAAIDGYRMNNREALLLRDAQTRDVVARADLVSAETEAARLPEEIAKQLLVRAEIPKDLDEALQALDALRDELKAWARLEVARTCGDPVVTTAVINLSEQPKQ